MSALHEAEDSPRGAWLCALGLFGLLAMSWVINPAVLRGHHRRSPTTQADIDLELLNSALRKFVALRGGDYPDRLQEIVQPGMDGKSLAEIPALPLDPWGRDYIYSVLGDGSGFSLFTLGADGEAGGQGEDADHSLVSLPPSSKAGH